MIFFQVVLSQRFERKILKKPIEVYNHLRKSNPSPFMFYFNYSDFKVLGSSPEILVRLRKKIVTVRPIAGTRPRGRNQNEDRKYEKDLLKDKKELAEHFNAFRPWTKRYRKSFKGKFCESN